VRKVLLVRQSSMGDIIHTWPMVSDLVGQVPQIQVDWVVEEGFAELPRMHPAVKRVIPVALRRWRKRPFSAQHRAEMWGFFRALRQERYDCILDTQGLLKSALIARLAFGPVYGYDRQSSREPIASLFYHRKVHVPADMPMIRRYREVAAVALNYTVDERRTEAGVVAPDLSWDWLPQQPYCVLLTATARDSKLWAEENWLSLGRALNARGLCMACPWGSAAEKTRAEALASQLPLAIVPPKMTLSEVTVLLDRSRAVFGVDTGLTHLAAALGKPTLAIWCASPPELAGLPPREKAFNVGKNGAPPTVQEVFEHLPALLG
jgi:lipopolysaccharide heptosyltransferase I